MADGRHEITKAYDKQYDSIIQYLQTHDYQAAIDQAMVMRWDDSCPKLHRLKCYIVLVDLIYDREEAGELLVRCEVPWRMNAGALSEAESGYRCAGLADKAKRPCE
ncbi:hypothetical protein LTR53_017559 [Teratosphaeriaceae sp. CCFEE 6253]|nr:hypothetical protein LTR53_017559 [Teratosphaeriaceae sp. CCFEE 6253]